MISTTEQLGSKLTKIFETGQTGSAPRNLAMEGLRGLAVTLVFFVHFGSIFQESLSSSPVLSNIVTYLAVIGNCGVDIFFAISGYLIYGSVLAKQLDYRKFMWRRVQRIYPTFLAVMAIYLVISKAYPAENKFPAGTFASLVYLGANLLLMPGLFPINPIITVSWTLSYEIFFYLSIPIIIGVTQMRNWRSRNRLCLFIGLQGIILVFFQSANLPRFALFISGILVYELIKVQDINVYVNRKLFIFLNLVILLTLPIYRLINEILLGGTPVLLLGVPCLLLLAFQQESLVHRLFTWSPIRWLGNISYSYYLIHGLTLKILHKVLSVEFTDLMTPQNTFWIILPLAFLLTLCSASCLFVLIEKPFSFYRSNNENSSTRYQQVEHLLVRFGLSNSHNR